MKPFSRIGLIAVLLSAVLFVGGLAIHQSTARACGQSSIPGSTVTDQFVNPSPPHTLSVIVSFSLWFDSCTGDNFTVANTTGEVTNGFTMYAIVNRASGPDGGALSNSHICPQSGPCTSDGVHSPNNLAQAEIFISGGNTDPWQRAYSSWF